MNVEELAKLLYETHCKSVGGLAFGGDPLPTWETIMHDETKQKLAGAWRAVASMAVTTLVPIEK